MTDSALLTEVDPLVPSNARRSSALQVAVLVGTWLIATWYMLHMLERGWIPHDEGLLAQSAERVLAGEMPHRDFNEAYSGGLTYLNALAFQLWGIHLMSLRLMLLLFFILWVPCYYYCATRLVPPIAAGAVTLVAVAWGPPNYPAGLPSWYNLFFATAAMAAVFRYLEVRRPVWLFVAGALAGTSCLFKVSGLYAIASVLLFLLFYEATQAQMRGAERPAQARAYLALVVGALAVFGIALRHLIGTRLGPPEAVHFLLPGLSIALMVIAEEYRTAAQPIARRVSSMARLVAPFCLGALLPLALFFALFAAAGSTGALWYGAGQQPLRRLVHAAVSPPPLALIVPSLALGVAAFLSSDRFRRLRVVIPWAVAIVLGFLVLRASREYEYGLAWLAVYCAPPVVTLMGCALLLTSRGRALPRGDRQRVALALCVLGLFTLIQFPFSAPIYFCYVAPLLFLAVAALGRLPGSYNRYLGIVLTVFALVFPVFRVTPGFVYNMGIRSSQDEQQVRLTIPRAAGLKVTATEAEEYSALVKLIQTHSPPGSSILVTPDAPEVYFLAQRRNPTRVFFDFLDPDTNGVLQAVRLGEVSLVVINSRPGFSGLLDERAVKEARLAFTNADRAGRFTVRWR